MFWLLASTLARIFGVNERSLACMRDCVVEGFQALGRKCLQDHGARFFGMFLLTRPAVSTSPGTGLEPSFLPACALQTLRVEFKKYAPQFPITYRVWQGSHTIRVRCSIVHSHITIINHTFVQLQKLLQ